MLRQGDSFLENLVEVCIFLVQVDIEMKTKRSGGPGSRKGMNDPPGAQSTLGSVFMKMALEAGGEELGLRS